ALVDYRMPVRLGTELLAHLHRTQPGCVRILVTAYGDSSVLREAINAGHVYRYTPKPIDPEQLLVDLARALEHRDAREQLEGSEKLALVGRFVGSVVHDLRNYLVVLRCTPDLLEAGDPESIADSIGRLRYVDAGISDLVEELVGLGRGKVRSYRRTPESLARVARVAVSICRGILSFEGRGMGMEVEPDLPDIPLAKSRCERMVTNLLLNAVQ